MSVIAIPRTVCLGYVQLNSLLLCTHAISLITLGVRNINMDGSKGRRLFSKLGLLLLFTQLYLYVPLASGHGQGKP